MNLSIAKRVHFLNGPKYSMRIDFFTNRTFCEPNQKFDKTSSGPDFFLEL
jgi:hypothetical protein